MSEQKKDPKAELVKQGRLALAKGLGKLSGALVNKAIDLKVKSEVDKRE